MRLTAAVLLLLVLVPAALAAQDTTGSVVLQPDARVRVRLLPAPDPWVTGRVSAVRGDTLLLRDAGVERVSLRAVDRLEVSRGKARLRWTLGGAAVGMLGGILYSRATLDDDPADIGGVQNSAEGVANTIVGMLLGGAAGYALAPERWTHVPLSR